MRDTTVKKYADLRGGRLIAGQVAPRTPKNCLDCHVPLVPAAVRAVPEGHGKHRGHGYCSPCFYRRKAAGDVWDGPAPERTPSTGTQWRAADLVAEWEFLRVHAGLNRDQAAERLGVKPSTLTTAACRARKYAERDKERAERAAVETEAHRINDDMIAYAARKTVAA